MSVRQRNLDFEAGPFAWSAVEMDRAAVELQRLLHDREPQPGARDVANVARAMEGLEYPRLVLRGNADTRVADLERSLAVHDAHLEVDLAALRRILDGVGNEIHQHVAQQPLVDVDAAAR